MSGVASGRGLSRAERGQWSVRVLQSAARTGRVGVARTQPALQRGLAALAVAEEDEARRVRDGLARACNLLEVAADGGDALREGAQNSGKQAQLPSTQVQSAQVSSSQVERTCLAMVSGGRCSGLPLTSIFSRSARSQIESTCEGRCA
jgi:hypothetical protein